MSPEFKVPFPTRHLQVRTQSADTPEGNGTVIPPATATVETRVRRIDVTGHGSYFCEPVVYDYC